jgi:ABC-type polar amino acid transport system ATPase subunit
MLVGRNLSKTFGSLQAVDGIDLELAPGTILSLIGPSGSGKSTLVRALSLVDPPTRGEVIIDNICYSYPQQNRQISPFPWPHVTVVFQQLFLWPHLTLRENIELPASYLHLPGIPRRIKDLVKFFELESCLARFPHQVSVGQRQRAAIIRALGLHPKYLLLDEVTAALDVEQTFKLAQCLREEREKGCGILVVSHFLGFVRMVADHFLFIDDGRAIEQGPVAALDSPQSDRVRKFIALETGDSHLLS